MISQNFWEGGIKVKLKLKFGLDTLDKPILSNVILKTNIPINILEAKVTSTTGEMLVDITANSEATWKVVTLLKEYNVHVEEITYAIEIDRDKCIACGACVSPCPTRAVTQRSDWQIELDDKKCVRCKICVDACPVRAIDLL